jgi:hypothetical protein
MSVDSPKWMTKKISFSVVSDNTCDSASWDISCIRRSDIGIYRTLFHIPRQSYYLQIYSMLIKLLTQTLYVISSLFATISTKAYFSSWALSGMVVILIHCSAWRVWLAISLLKYSIGFSHKCECFVRNWLLSLLEPKLGYPVSQHKQHS